MAITWKSTPLTVRDTLNLMLLTGPLNKSSMAASYKACIELLVSRAEGYTVEQIMDMNHEEFTVLQGELADHMVNMITSGELFKKMNINL